MYLVVLVVVGVVEWWLLLSGVVVLVGVVVVVGVVVLWERNLTMNRRMYRN